MDTSTWNRKVRLERLVSTSNGFGSGAPGFEPVGVPVWASVQVKTGRATIAADADSSLVQAAVRVRFRLDVQAGWRVAVVRLVDGDWVTDQVFTVDAALPDLAGREYTDLAVSGVSNVQR